MKGILHKLNVSRHLAHHLIGEKHNEFHHKTIGFVIMMIGVGFVHLTLKLDCWIISLISEMFGWGIHAIGWLPYIEAFERGMKEEIRKEFENKSK